ncbi:LysR family transcriptional regulator [Zhihengliuella halotolerans]|uniref:DNA-binding transcriptional LysR family regulator n=1 Tax=Zhihengliuella halotolerans TaxID=370736 RepID=A0A4Q8AH65_9MICC|nr:LysR family transcriptional regulator [Zhihengliuella halotolerans]RZU63688.1 DNA-binding transcriptional LysR family regulator [Zhihengliuella halotolerans]
MLFRQLEYFVALARERHFARAAEVCFVSQPALSEAIRKLERELGVPLVRRGHSFQGLTPEGERVLLWARRILADHDALHDEVAALHAGLTGTLRVGVNPAATSAAAVISAAFCTTHPRVELSLETNLRSADIVDRVQDFELDAGIVYLDEDTADQVRVQTLYRERLVLIASERLLLDAGEPSTWADAANLPLCLLPRGMRGREVLDHALADRGVAVRPQIEADSIVALLAHVMTGRWASVVPEQWLPGLALPQDLRTMPLDGPAIGAHMALISHAAEPASVLARALFEAAGTVDRFRESSD